MALLVVLGSFFTYYDSASVAGTDADSQTWTLTELFLLLVATLKSILNKNMLHAYEGTPTMQPTS